MITYPRVIWIIFISTITLLQTTAQNNDNYFDGPYISFHNSNLLLQWIQNGEKYDTIIDQTDAKVFEKIGLPKVDLTTLSSKINTTCHFENIGRWAAISDIHGQYDLFVKLLRGQEIIDSLGHWSYGDGHLVIVGDVFDRGPKVTETLWFLFGLEKQAELSGGKVHLLLGNHELMIMQKDLEYINVKYKHTQKKLKTSYDKLYGENTVLGNWLRTKPISITINDVAFVHAGFTRKVLKRTNSISNINKIFRENYYTKNDLDRSNKELRDLLYYKEGPLWYRGYANPKGFNQSKTNEILRLLNKSERCSCLIMADTIEG